MIYKLASILYFYYFLILYINSIPSNQFSLKKKKCIKSLTKGPTKGSNNTEKLLYEIKIKKNENTIGHFRLIKFIYDFILCIRVMPYSSYSYINLFCVTRKGLIGFYNNNSNNRMHFTFSSPWFSFNNKSRFSLWFSL